MEIKSVSGRGSALSLNESEEKAYKDFKETQQYADKKDDYSLKRIAEEKFLSLVNPFLKSIGLNLKGLDWEVKDNQRAVKCEDFEMGDSDRNYGKKTGYGFKYTPIVVFGLNGTISIYESYARAPRLRTTVEITDDIVSMVYRLGGDGLENPKIQMVREGSPRIYIASAKQIQPVLFRLQDVFKEIGDDRLGALIHLHYEAENQNTNIFTANLLRRTYRNLLETLVR